MIQRCLTVTVLMTLAFTLPPRVGAEDKPTEVTVGEMRIQTVPAMNYLYTSAETSFEKMGEPVKAGFDKVFFNVVQSKLLVARPTMLVYQGNPHFDPAKPFKMEIGVILLDDAKPEDLPEDVKLRKTEPFKCATILYTGPVMQQGKAYEKLIPALRAAGHTPTGEEREMCLYWEGLESNNNVFMMQIGIK